MTDSEIFPLCVLGVGFIVLVAVVVLVIQVGTKEQRQWDEFSKAHKCRLVTQSNGTFGYGVSAKGTVVTTYAAGQNGYLCDDGVTYFR